MIFIYICTNICTSSDQQIYDIFELIRRSAVPKDCPFPSVIYFPSRKTIDLYTVLQLDEIVFVTIFVPICMGFSDGFCRKKR